MIVVDIQNMDEFDQARSENPEAIIRLVLDEVCCTLFFPHGHPVGRHMVRC
jgi:hypothetical protein